MKLYLVGGAVRDSLLNIFVKERDWVVVGATPKDMINAGFNPVGKEFPVFLHPKSHEEYALARTERKSGLGYYGFTCSTSPKVTLKEDLFRRDLTVNAIAKDKLGNLIDPYNGINDINKRLLRHVSSAFNEDPIRVLRVARFAAKLAHFKFKIAPETMQLMKQMKNELLFVSPERIWKETEKALNTSSPHTFFKVLRKCNALKFVFPELDVLFGIPTIYKFKKKIDTGIHSLMSLNISAQLSNNINVRFASLFHDIAKGLTPKKGVTNYHEYGLRGENLILTLCKRLKIPNRTKNLAKIAVKYHYLLHYVDKLSSRSLIKLFSNIDAWRRPERLENLIIISESDFRGKYGFENKCYLPGMFLRKAYNIASSVSSTEIVQQGLTGVEISKSLFKKRQQVLDYLKC